MRMSNLSNASKSLRPIRDVRLRLVGPLVLYGFGVFCFRYNIHFAQERSREEQIRYLVIGLLAGYVCWNVARWVILRIQRRFKSVTQTQKRHSILFGVAWPVLTIFCYSFRYLGHALWTGILALPDIDVFAYSIGIQLFYNCVYIGVYEGIYMLRQWRRTYREKEELVQAHWQIRFDSLKNQVNPHFLFNSLNTLSSLIGEDAAKAEQFVDEMANVYRYLLRSNTTELTTLRQELQFIQSYFHLLQTRYGKGVSLQVAIDERYQDWQIPPLTLQLLVENAVKHNVILPESPLSIVIQSAGNHELVVANNLQRKDLRVHSNQLGLVNIATKYELLGEYQVSIREENNAFVVTLPLIAATVKQ